LFCAALICTSLWTHKELSRRTRLIYSTIIIVLISGTAYRVSSNAEKKELQRNAGPLFAANDQTPLNTCPIPANSFLVFLGDSTITSASGFPHSVFKFGGQPVLSLDKDKADNLLLSFQVFDDRGDIIVRMSQTKDGSNSYWVKPDCRMERKDRSSLSVFDHKDQVVLDVRYLNFSAVKITGTFRDPKNPSRKVIVADDYVRTPAGTFYSISPHVGLTTPQI
jgi:hypothetical protein